MKIQVNWNGLVFDGTHTVSVQNDSRGVKQSQIITIPKTEESINAFIGWPAKQGVNFECYPFGSGDYFLVAETATSYIFE
ncbi:UNVERIFIED_ORG: hypothetical protein EOZ59_0972 [Serratia quinivorans]